MSGETEKQVSAWQTDTLKEYLERRLDDLERRLEQRFEDTQIAISKAETAHEKRFDSVNEFRAQLKDQQATFIPRAEAEKSIAANADKIDALQARMDRNEGRSGGFSSGWGYLVAAIGLIATLIVIAAYLKK